MGLMKASIQFDHPLREWDGFGFNFVETAQTQDYAADPQDYGSFNILCYADPQRVLEMVFGDDGLQPKVFRFPHISCREVCLAGDAAHAECADGGGPAPAPRDDFLWRGLTPLINPIEPL